MEFNLEKLRKPVQMPVATKLKEAGVSIVALAQVLEVSSDYLCRVLNGHCKGGKNIRESLRQLEAQLG